MRRPIASDAGTNLNTFRSMRPLNSIVQDVLEMDSCELVSFAQKCEKVSLVSVKIGATEPN